jgi:hypothetical protein
VSREADPTCPVPGRPCLRVLDDLQVELARVKAREEARPPVPCLTCGERSRIALGGATRCYRCVSGHAAEADHVRGSGSGPAALRTDSNINRIAAEGERMWRRIRCDDLCAPCINGFGLRLGILLARIEVDL